MGHDLQGKIRKAWKSGKYNSKRELVNGVISEMGIDPNGEYISDTIWVINRFADNIIQGGNGSFWKK